MRASKAREYRPRCATTATRNHAESWGSMNKPGRQARAQEEHLQRATSDGGRARWCPTRRALVVPEVELAPARSIVFPRRWLRRVWGFVRAFRNSDNHGLYPSLSSPGANRARNFAPRSAFVSAVALRAAVSFAGNDPSRASDDTERSAAREERHSSRAAELLSFALRAAAAPGRRHSRGPLHWRCARWPSVHPVAT